MINSSWQLLLEQERKEKDIYFSEYYESPLPYENRNHFKGLDYYPPNPDFRFKLELHEHEEKKIVKIEDTQGNERAFLRCGEFVRFKINNTECILQAYKSNPNEDRLFVPFKDKTSGKETYGAGRYLDLEHEEQGKWLLDFNRAYNPWCAYNDFYACPFVDPENWLDILVPAGEKNYSDQKQ